MPGLPFDWIRPDARPWALAVLTVASLALSIWLAAAGGPLHTTQAPNGIVSFELAGTQERAGDVLRSWSGEAYRRALLIQGVDALYLVVYPAWLSLAAGLVSRRLGPRAARIGRLVAWAVLLAAPLDAVENHALVVQLLEGPSAFHAALARFCAIPKFGLVAAAGLFLLGASVAWAGSWTRGRASGDPTRRPDAQRGRVSPTHDAPSSGSTSRDGRGIEVLALDHVYLGVTDLQRSEAFYDQVFRVLGFHKGDRPIGGEPHVHYFNRVLQISLRPSRGDADHDPYAPGLHHLCLQLPTPADVDRAHTALLDLGVTASEPRLYPEYAPDYHAIFFEDPDGIRLELVARRAHRDEIVARWDELETFLNPLAERARREA